MMWQILMLIKSPGSGVSLLKYKHNASLPCLLRPSFFSDIFFSL